MKVRKSDRKPCFTVERALLSQHQQPMLLDCSTAAPRLDDDPRELSKHTGRKYLAENKTEK